MLKNLLLALSLTTVMPLAALAQSNAIVYDIKPDTIIANADKSNTKQRPFIVDKEEYPFESHWYQRDGVSMHYVDEGEGIPIILTHGNPDWSFLNRNIIKEISKEARVISYDLPGFGFSDTPKNYNFTPQEHVEWINALVFEHLKLDKFILVVQDWGGPTGLSIATSHPDNVLGVVISNTWAWPATGGLQWFSMAMRQPAMESRVINQNFFATALMQGSINEKSRNNKAITDAYAMAFPTPESRKGTAVFPKQVTLAAPWLAELESRLHTLSDKHIEFIFGLKDDVVASESIRNKWRSIFPNAPVQLLPDAGHFTQEDSPESFVFSLQRILKKVNQNK